MNNKEPRVKPNVLVADDVAHDLYLLETMLKKLDVNLILAHSGSEALNKIHGIELALAIINVRMPEMNGYELSLKMNEERSGGVPIIFLTASHFNEIEVFNGYGSGVVDYIFKPVDNHILISKVNVFLTLFNQQQKIIINAALLKKSVDELSKVNDALKKKRKKYFELYNFAPSGYFTLSAEKVIQELNHSGASMLGKERSHLIGTRFDFFISKNTLPVFNAFFLNIFKSKAKEICEVMLETEGIQTKFVHIEGMVSGNGLQCLINVVDITGRKMVEQVLRESEELFKSVVYNSIDLTTITDANGIISFISPQCETVLGYPGDKFIGKRIEDIIHPDDVEKCRSAWEQAFYKGLELRESEYRIIDQQGSVRWVSHSAKWVKVDESVLGMQNTIRNITERKRTEAEMNKQREILQGIFDNIPVMITYFDKARKIKIGNRELVKNLGWTFEEWETENIFEKCFPKPESLKEALDFMSSDQMGWKDFTTTTKYGTVIETTWTTISLPDGGLLGIGQDITERKRVNGFDNELLQLSLQLTRISGPGISAILELALSRIGKFLAADRAYIFEFNPTENTMSNTHEWCNEGIQAQIGNLQDVPCSIFPNWMATLQRHENIIIPSVQALPDTWQAEREILEYQGIQSLVVIPILNENNLTGYIGLDAVLKKKDDNDSEINGLRVWSNMLTSLMNNQRIEVFLDQTRQNYETFFNTIDDFLFVLDEQGNIIHTNTTVIDRLGYTRKELLGKSVLMIHPPKRRDEVGRIAGEILNGAADFCSVPLITKSGIQIFVETKVSQGVWDGKPAIFRVSKDISQIKLSEEKFSKIFYLNPSACSLSDLVTGEHIEVNEAFCNLLGFDKNEVIGKTPVEFGVLTLESLNTLYLKINASEKVSNLEANLIAKNGDVKHVLLSAENIYIQDKKCRFTVVHDITDRIQAKQSLEVSEEKYKTLLNASPDGILLINMKGVITEVSEIGLELFGTDTKDDLVGKNFFRFIPFDEKNTIREIIEKTMNEGLSQNIELKIRKINQSLFAGETSATLIQDPDGVSLSFMIIIRDISQRKKIEAKQLHADRMANLGEMATGIAHEINQPLNIISMVMDKILFESAKTETIGIEFLENKSGKIFENIIRIRNIIDHIRAFSRSASDYVLTAFDINSSIENAVSMTMEQLKHLGINLNLQLDKQIPQIVGNTYKFEQVIINLLANAKDAIEEKQSIQEDYFKTIIGIRTYQKNQFLIVEVTDNGIGIGNDDINNILLPFYTTKDEGKGTGVGLSICYQIIKEMNGTIDITSDHFYGTKIKLVLDTQKKK